MNVMTDSLLIGLRQVKSGRNAISYCIQDLIVGCQLQLPLSSDLSNHWLVQSGSGFLEADAPTDMNRQAYIPGVKGHCLVLSSL